MKLKYYMRGLGIGIMVTALIMSISSGTKKTMTDAQIIARAKQLGMISGNNVLSSQTSEEAGMNQASGNNVSEGAASKTNTSETKPDKTIDSSKIEDSSTGQKQDTKNTAQAKDKKTEALSNDEISSTQIEKEDDEISNAQIEKEDAAGVAGTNHDDQKPEVKEEIADDDKTADDNKTTNDNDTTDKAEIEDKDDKSDTENTSIQITVASGNGSDTISRKLAEANLVDDAAKFDQYLCDHNYDNRITVGKHTIPTGATYEEIAKILTAAAE